MTKERLHRPNEIDLVLILKERIEKPTVKPGEYQTEDERREVFLSYARRRLRKLEDPVARAILIDTIEKYKDDYQEDFREDGTD